MSKVSFSVPRYRLQEMLNAITETERGACERDLYGQNEVVEETFEFQQDVLKRLDEKLFEINEEREAFDLAQLQCPDYVNGNDFRLMFLRSTRFDVPKTAAKIIHYWSRKVDLFGRDRAFSKLSLQDFEDEDQPALLNGGMRSLPERDEAGRGIFFSYRTLWDNRRTNQKSNCRVLWYIIHALVEDVEVQHNGIVLVLANLMDSFTTHDTKLNRVIWRDAQNALPVLVQGTHQLVHSQTMSLVLETTLYAAGARIQNRFKIHRVKCREMAGELEEYGISLDDVPPEIGGTLDFDYSSWLEERRRSETNDEE